MIKDLRIVYVNKSSDDRGDSSKIPFDSERFTPNEIFVSHSRKNVIRGMHLQVEPHTQRKLVYVINGEVEGVILDLRPDSETFGETETVVLKGCDDKAVFIPEKCAWGFESIGDDNILIYAIEGIYDIKCERGVRFDSFGHKWKCFSEGTEPVMSEKDKHLIEFEQWRDLE